MAITPSDYSRQVEITGASAPASTLTGYVALITEANLPSEIWSTALNGGGDLRVCTDSAGTDQLPLEVVSFDTVAETAVLWVRFASYSSAARAIWLFYGKTGDSQPTPSSTYGSQSVWQDYEAVLHMNETGTDGVFYDSTGNGHDSTLTLGSTLPTVTTGNPFGLSWPDFSSANALTLTSSAQMLNNSAMTMSCWLNADVDFDQLGLVGNRYQSFGDSEWFQLQSSGRAFAKNTATEDFVAGSLNRGNTIRRVATHDSTSLFSIINGTKLGEDTSIVATGGISSAIGQDYRVATYYSGGSSTQGRICEVRLSKFKTSMDLASEEYNNQSSPATFWTTGTPQDTSGGGPTYSLTLDAGSYVHTGSAVDLIVGRKIGITAGSYIYTGSPVDLKLGRKLSITPGSYTYTGSAVDLIAGRKITIDPANYTYTGNDVTLTYTPTGGATYSLTLDAGSYALTGSSVDLLVNRKLSLGAGSFSYTGSAVNLIVGRKLTITAGSYAVNGQAVDLKSGRKLSIDAGAYNYSGLPVTLSYSGVVISLISGYSVQYRQDDISINFNSDNIQAEFT